MDKTVLSESEKAVIQSLLSDFKLVRSNKLSIHESYLLFLGTLFYFFSQKFLFKRNSDLKNFVNNTLLDYLKKDVPYKNYLFSSRYNFISRVQKDIITNLGYQDIVNLSLFLEELITKSFPISKESKKGTNNKISPIDFISEWSHFIRNNK